MAKTMAEKILGRASGKDVAPGEIVEANVDLAMVHDLTGPHVVEVVEEIAGEVRVWDPDKVAIIFDHHVPADKIRAAELQAIMRRVARRLRISKFHDVGRGGICHQVLVEERYVRPGMLVVGADSHTVTSGAVGAFATGIGASDMAMVWLTGKLWFKVPESIKVNVTGTLPKGVYSKDVILNIIGTVTVDGATYKAVEFHGDTIRRMSIPDRMTLTNMTVEMGGKAGMVPADEVTVRYFEEAGIQVKPFGPDPGARYEDEWNFEVSNLEPQVAAPYSVDNVHPVSEVEGTPIDQAFIGSCTNGRYEDFVEAARILKGRKVADGVRCIAIPASIKQYSRLLKEGIIDILTEAGCFVAHSTCGPCLGGHLGVLGPEEVAISSSNRNFRGRMGHPTSKVYLASPATVAASAVEGKIADPRKYL
ncbi:MAG: 3-isopropylmalate dehydratase large subunit [Crenarchaeota archaeon]|nr:3-isopropylmalate dehydratase large subunit [Thermoproteota archaeon]